MQKHSLKIIGIVLFVLIVLLTVTSFRQEAQSNKLQQLKEEATVVRRGQGVTQEEYEYSKEYKKLYNYRRDGEKLTEIKEPEGIIINIGSGSKPRSSSERVLTANQFLEKLSCEADAVVVGTVNNSKSHLSADETFIYTSYDFEVKRIIKDSSQSPIETNGTIAVTRPGGSIRIDERVIKFHDASYELLKKNKEYLLFLKFVPTANGYIVSSIEGDFTLEDNNFKSISKRGVVKELRNGIDSKKLLDMVESVTSSNCSQYLLGGRKDDE